MTIYNNRHSQNIHLVTFTDVTRNSNDLDIDQMLQEMRTTFVQVANNNDGDSFQLDQQVINTENDLKCLVFSKIRQINLATPFEVHSEESDKIAIDDNYCIGLTEVGDIANESTNTRQTDLTVTVNPQENAERGLNKGYSRNGKHINIELKYIRKGFSAQYLKDIRRDLCKLKYLVDPNPNRNLPILDHGTNEFGIFFLGFRKRSVLERYLIEGLEAKINNFNQVNNTAILLFFREDI